MASSAKLIARRGGIQATGRRDRTRRGETRAGFFSFVSLFADAGGFARKPPARVKRTLESRSDRRRPNAMLPLLISHARRALWLAIATAAFLGRWIFCVIDIRPNCITTISTVKAALNFYANIARPLPVYLRSSSQVWAVVAFASTRREFS
jgi:hypothetical protein